MADGRFQLKAILHQEPARAAVPGSPREVLIAFALQVQPRGVRCDASDEDRSGEVRGTSGSVDQPCPLLLPASGRSNPARGYVACR